MPEGFKIPDDKAKQLRALLAKERALATVLKVHRETTNKAVRVHLEMIVLPKAKAWLQARNELADYVRGIWKDQHENHKAWMNGYEEYDGSYSCAKAQGFMRDLRMQSTQVMDSPEDISHLNAPVFAWDHPDAVYRNPFTIDFHASAPADTKANILKDLGVDREDDEDEGDHDYDGKDDEKTDNDDLVEGLEELSTQELEDFLSTMEDGMTPEELEKALAKLEG